ncbi:MAG: carbon starvation protein A, partial [bacterium]
ARKIFSFRKGGIMPSHEYEDGVDYVPTKKNIIFGHHFTTIAGLGPIVGPAIGIIWGWLPAFIWIFFGSIFMGAVHDFATLVISANNKGKTIGKLTGTILDPSTRYAFQFIMQLLLFIVLSVFSMIVSTLFIMYPEAVIPVWLQIPIAIWLGRRLKRKKNELFFSIIAVLLMYVSILIGVKYPVDIMSWPIINQLATGPVEARNLATVTWCLILFIYVFFASTLPVQKLLQPRDYINSHQLLVAMLLIIIGLFVVHPKISAPAINQVAFTRGSGIPSLMPLLFIIIACGAISGFHSIASSGTTVKQVDKENDMLFIGYGGMILEGFLAILVLMAVAGGLGLGLEKNGVLYTGRDAFLHHYSSWTSANAGIGAKLESFIVGSANLFQGLGIPKSIGGPMIAVFIVSFANTTLDSAARIQRLSLQEIFTSNKGNIAQLINNRYFSTFIVVVAAAILTFIKPGGKGALLLWPLFGSLNQLLAALALGIVSVYIITRQKPIYSLTTLIPMIFVLVMTLWSMIENIIRFIEKGENLLVILSMIVLFLTTWLLVNGFQVIGKLKTKTAVTSIT